MALPGVELEIANGGLGLQPASSERGLVFVGLSTGGVAGDLTFYGDASSLEDGKGVGEVCEAAAYALSVAGGPVGVLSVTPTTVGGKSSVTQVGGGAMTCAVSFGPHVAIAIAVTTGGTLGTACFTFALGGGAASAPVTSAAGWSSTGYLIPGTYCTLVFTAGTYTTSDTYTVSTLNVLAHPAGAGPAVPASSTCSPIDDYTPVITVTKAGALATSQFTYSLDGTDANTSSPIVTTAGGTYAIPSTGIILTFVGTAVADDTYSFSVVGPSFSNSDLVTALTYLTTTYLSSSYSMVCIVGKHSSAANWGTEVSSLATIRATLFSSGVYVRFMDAVPTVGTLTSSAGSVVVNSASTDAALLTQRLSTSTGSVAACAGDMDLTSVITGLSHRRNGIWAAAARAAGVEASQSIGAVADGALTGVTDIYRDEFATEALDAVGFITLRTFPGNIAAGTGLAGFYITNGWTLDSVTSDYAPLANARVIDRACGVAKAAALPLVNSKIPTKTGGVILERKAQSIEGRINNAMLTALVNTDPQNAVACSTEVNRVHNILADGLLIITIAIQPFAYARFITVNIGLVVEA